ncbi:hypothetical protein BJX76DRAFT_320496 [Aspergillus varians]
MNHVSLSVLLPCRGWFVSNFRAFIFVFCVLLLVEIYGPSALHRCPKTEGRCDLFLAAGETSSHRAQILHYLRRDCRQSHTGGDGVEIYHASV